MSATWPAQARDLSLRILVLMVVLSGAAYFLQDSLLHHPEGIELPAALALARDLRLAPWPDAGQPRGWLREPADAARGTVVLFHGNGGHALHRDWYADMLQQHGYRTLLAEYPGYGHRSGAKDEASLVGDATEIISALDRAYPGPLLVAGESLGAGVAAATLARIGTDSSVSGVLLITPWDSLANVASHYYPRPLVGLVLRDRYDSTGNLAGYAGPKLVMIAGRDSIIPAELGRKLFSDLGSPKKLVELPGADHNDWTGAVSVAKWREILAFLEGA